MAQEKTMKMSEDLQRGDILKMIWCGNKVIKCFEPYIGKMDFIDRKAVFHDGTKMSLEKGRFYEVVNNE